MQLAAIPKINISSERGAGWRSDEAHLTTSVDGSAASVQGDISRGIVPNPLAAVMGPLFHLPADSHFITREHAVDVTGERGSGRAADAVVRLHALTDSIAASNPANQVTSINLSPFEPNSSFRFGAEPRDVYADAAAARLGSRTVLQQLEDAARAVIKASW
ncbi:MAG: hypothetical protein JWN72_1792 [Thermoleophilia bacterium]|nr:hypothetical protein [Thermoleophilia bacterium]